ncbi:RETST reductase, partial [Crypturellus soui]|nr:RETST reductase [Crypturellus soui]
GIHYVGQLREGAPMRFLLEQLTEGQLQWAPLPAAFDAVLLGEPGAARPVHLRAGARRYFEALKERFPHEAAAIDAFRGLLKSVDRGTALLLVLKLLPLPLARWLCRSGILSRLSAFCRLATRSLHEVVAELTGDADLRAVLSYILPTYGAVPSRASFSLHAILVNHFLGGAWYPRGGAGEIAFHTVRVVQRAGGAALARAPVTRILLDGHGRACGESRRAPRRFPPYPHRDSPLFHALIPGAGVSVRKGQEDVNIFAPVVISDAGIFNTYERLLPAEARALPGIQEQLRLVTPGEGGFSVFVGLNGTKEELGLESTNYFIYKGNDMDQLYGALRFPARVAASRRLRHPSASVSSHRMRRYLESSREEAAENIPFLFITSPSCKDPTWDMRHPGKATLAVVTFANYEWFEEWRDEPAQRRSDDYEDAKRAFVDTIMRTVYKLYPGIEDRVEYVSGGTPLTNQHFIASAHGEMYGARQDTERLRAEAIATLRPRTAVPNLYLTGQDVCLAGFMGALQGAVLCAGAVLGR